MKPTPTRDSVMPDKWYLDLDPGIRFAVRVLHAAGGVETCQSCQGGKGHAYEGPTVDLVSGADDARGFRAVAALEDYGLHVAELSLVWPMRHGLPYERLWRVRLVTTHEARADERPIFVFGYRAV